MPQSSVDTSLVGACTDQMQSECIVLDEFSWDDTAGEDSDYMTWDTDNTDRTPANQVMAASLTPSGRDEVMVQPQVNRVGTVQPPVNRVLAPALAVSARDEAPVQPPVIPPPFDTPPKLSSVEQVLKNFPGRDVTSLRSLTMALARDAMKYLQNAA